MNVFSKRLRELRKKLGLTQSQLAEKLGVSSSSIGMYEQGRREPDSAMLSRICSTLNVSIDYLLGFERFDSHREVEDVIGEFTEILRSQKTLMFKGSPISNSDKEKIVNAIKIAAAVAISDTTKM